MIRIFVEVPTFTKKWISMGFTDDDLVELQNRLSTLLSRRVFLTGGGYAPGQNGGKITDGAEPVSINTETGEGVPGGFNNFDRRGRQVYDDSQIQI